MKIIRADDQSKKSYYEIKPGEVFQAMASKEYFYMRTQDGAVCLNDGAYFAAARFLEYYYVVEVSLRVEDAR